MKQSLQIGIGIIVLILFLAFINLQPKKKPINWKATFSKTDKIPFGTYVLYEELKTWTPDNAITRLTDSQFFAGLDTDSDSTETAFLNDSVPTNLILIRPEFYIYTYEEERLLEYISEGNTVFISSTVFPYHFFNLIDTNITMEYDYSSAPVHITTHKQDSIIFPKGKFEHSFRDSLETYETYSYTKHTNGEFHSGLIKIPVGEGQLILHNFPYALTNYYLLHENEAYRTHVSEILNMFPKQKTYWVTTPVRDYNNERGNSDKGLLDIIRQIPSLFSAWKLLLIGLLVYALFKAKREQRFIPIIPELKNASKDYIKVIANLHHEEKNYLNLVHKKMLYFFDQLKSNHHIDINHLSDSKSIITKTQSEEKDVTRILALVNKCQNQQAFTKEEFLEFCALADKILKS